MGKKPHACEGLHFTFLQQESFFFGGKSESNISNTCTASGWFWRLSLLFLSKETEDIFLVGSLSGWVGGDGTCCAGVDSWNPLPIALAWTMFYYGQPGVIRRNLNALLPSGWTGDGLPPFCYNRSRNTAEAHRKNRHGKGHPTKSLLDALAVWWNRLAVCFY